MKLTKRRVLRYAGKFFLSFCLLLNSSFAYPASFHSQGTVGQVNQQQDFSKVNYLNKDLPVADDGFALNSSQLGFVSPFSVGITSDSLLNYSLDAQYTKALGDNFAVSGLIESGKKSLRLNATVGFDLLHNGLFKFTGETISQVLPFTFDSGSIKQKIYQNALGARYQYAIGNAFVRDVSLGGYFAHAPSKWLEPINFTFQGVEAINYRHIAGGKSTGVDIGTGLTLSGSTGLTGHLYYDQVRYDTIFTKTATDDTQGFGGSLGINQLLGDHFLLSAGGSLRKLYDTYGVSIAFMPPSTMKLPFEMSLVGERLITHNQMRNGKSIGLKLAFNPNLLTQKNMHYSLPNSRTVEDITTWTKAPAIHMSRAMAVVDQLTVAAPAGAAINKFAPKLVHAELQSITVMQKGADKKTEIVKGAKQQYVAMGKYVGETVQQNITSSVVWESSDNKIVSVENAKSNVVGVSTTAGLVTAVGVGTAKLIAKLNGVTGDATVNVIATNKYNVRSDNPAPLVESISPSSVFNTESIVTVNITGENFIVYADGATVKLTQNGTDFVTVPHVSPFSATLIKNLQIPINGLPVGKYNVVVVNIDGKSGQLNNGFEIKVPVAPPVADFSGTPTDGAAPLVVQFTDTSTGTPTSWKWNFGDGATSTAQNPKHTYVTPGTYDVSLKVTNAGGSDTNIKPYYIVAIQKTYNIYAYTSGEGKITPEGTVIVNSGASQTFTILPSGSNHIDHVYIDDKDMGAIRSYTFTNVSSNHYIAVLFAQDENVTTNTANVNNDFLNNNSVSLGGVQMVADSAKLRTSSIIPIVGVGQNIYNIKAVTSVGGRLNFRVANNGRLVLFRAVGLPGYKLTKLRVDGVLVNSDKYTFENTASNHTIQAVFALALNLR